MGNGGDVGFVFRSFSLVDRGVVCNFIYINYVRLVWLLLWGFRRESLILWMFEGRSIMSKVLKMGFL